ncbi:MULTISPECIES: MarR family winged helix-turn-helix transcriptional regulator [unclassified Nocardioides]|uniref:MarR family winged helix-turn-helix transcriptional regulator n=1 Tax=unclassified Nocardioides TaxID=2615069 RepID=UPI001E284AD0|nr:MULTISPECIES: MarR family winged helix-turn-helix transcriptional regulator [unclassified Nocardioides]
MTDATTADLAEAVGEIEAQFTRMAAASRRRLREHASSVHPDLTPLGFALLTASQHLGRCPQSALVQRMQADKGAVSRAVAQLEHFGLIRREADPADRRSQLLELTPAGRAALAGVDSRSRELLHGQLEGWTLAEVQQLRDLLTRLNDAARVLPGAGPGTSDSPARSET